MKRDRSWMFYGSVVALAGTFGWFVGPYAFLIASAATVGACLAAVFAALYISELKQESISHLYQALASSTLRSAEQASFSDDALTKITVIRRLFFESNVVKLLGTLAAIYLMNEKQLPPPLPFD